MTEVNDMEKLKQYFDKKFESVLNKQKSNDVAPVKLQKKGNQAQADALITVLNLVVSAEDTVREGKLDGVASKLKKARKELQKRLKLVRIADRSEFGWDTVNEYISDEVASDSDDDRRIKRAENAAAGKRKKKQEEGNRKRGRFQEEARPPQQFFRGPPKPFSNNDKCFACGLPGHWARQCPNKNFTKTASEGQVSKPERN